MLHTCTLKFKGNWDKYLSLMEFAYNNSYHTSIKMAPFEVIDERKCCSLVGWFEPREAKLIRLDLVKDVIQKVKLIRWHLV